MHIIIHIIIYFNGILFCSSIPISMGDSTELALTVLWNNELGLALLRFLFFALVLVVFRLPSG